MTELILFRHGQAGSRLDYDQLSEQGVEQSRLLGRYLAANNFRFDHIFCGALRRQQETCRLVLEELRSAGATHPSPESMPAWNEFDLDLVYAHVAPALAAEDPVFARKFDDLQREAAAGTNGIHRRWTDTDSAIIHAWVNERFQLPIESWRKFHERITGAAEQIPRLPGRIAVFTSATPIGICVSGALGLDTWRILRLAGAQYNASFTRLWLSPQGPVLASFNETPHLAEPQRTLR